MTPAQNTWSVSFTIPGIDGKMAINPEQFARKERENLDRLVNAPTSISGRSLLGKMLIGLIIGALMAVLLFVLFGAVGSLVGSSAPEAAWLWTIRTQHELSRLINLFLGFLVSFIGNLLLITAYGFFFSQKYTKIWKTIGLLLLTNAILSLGMVALFLIFQDKPNAPVILFVLYVSLSLFLSFSQIEFVVNPNYSSSALMGNVIGFCISLVVLWGLLGSSTSSNVNDNDPQKLMLLTPLLSFPFMIFGQGIWEIIYAKMYENGANPFYLPSKAEMSTETLLQHQQEEQEQESVNVEL